MAAFAGYDMPISYPAGALEEHAITRRSAGLFDIDHMGQFEVSGKGADSFVDGLVSARILDMKVPQARYSLLLDGQGCVLDDLFVYRMEIHGGSSSTPPTAKPTWHGSVPEPHQGLQARPKSSSKTGRTKPT